MQSAREAAINAVKQLKPLIPAGESSQDEWSVRVRCNKDELGYSFSVYIFLGPVPPLSEKWYKSDAFVGTVDAFAGGNRRGGGGGDGGSKEANMEGFVHLNKAYLRRSGMISLEPEMVILYLKENLNWAVQSLNFFSQADGEVEEVESLEVMVLMTPMIMPIDGHIPRAGKPIFHPEITHGRKGGARSLTHSD